MKNIFTFIKILTLLSLNFLVFYIDYTFFLLCLLLCLIIASAIWGSGLSVRLKSILPAVLLIILFQLIFNTTNTFEHRIYSGFSAGIRLIIISFSVFLFMSITSVSEITRALNFLPKKVLLVIVMTMYFIPGLFKESESIKAVQKSRGLKINSWNIIAGLASLLVPLLHRVFKRAETLSLTLVSRGYEE